MWARSQTSVYSTCDGLCLSHLAVIGTSEREVERRNSALSLADVLPISIGRRNSVSRVADA